MVKAAAALAQADDHKRGVVSRSAATNTKTKRPRTASNTSH